MKEYIHAVQWYFGLNNKDAKEYCKNSNIETLNEILKSFKMCSVSSFYND